MSFSAMSYVMNLHQAADGTPLIPAEKLILILLADGWGRDLTEESSCSLQRLAYSADMDPRELEGHLEHLEEIGVLGVRALPQPIGRATHRARLLGFLVEPEVPS